MKRVVLIRNAYSYDFGGAERFVVNLAVELKKHDIEPVILTKHQKIRDLATVKEVISQPSPWWSRQDWSGHKVLLTPVYLLWQLYMTVWYLIKFIRLKPSVVHAQSKDDFISATIAAKILAIKVIWTDHADLKYIYQNISKPLKNPIGKIVWALSRFAKNITLVSESERKLVSTAASVTKIPSNYVVVYNGVTDFTPDKYERPVEQVKSLVYCCTSRLVTAKGICELISSFNDLSKSHDDIDLWVLGEGPEEDKFKGLASGNTHIHFLGFPDNSYSILNAADIFVHPSYHEGFSISLIEAAMLAKPIIACNVGGNPEIVVNEQTGLLVKEKSAEELLIAMRRLYEDKKLRHKVAKNARNIYVDSFQFDRIVEKDFLRLYEI